MTSLAVFQAKALLKFPAQMPKRKGDQLTGGSGDVNPQILTIQAIQPAADITIVKQQPLPIPRFPTSPGKNLVVELLGVDYYHYANNINAGGANQNLITITTAPTVFPSLPAAILDPRNIDAWFRILVAPAVITDTYNVETENYQDLTDSAGHGILVASDNIYVGVYSNATFGTNGYIVKLFYRWKEVTLTEYIGIVQSQQ